MGRREGLEGGKIALGREQLIMFHALRTHRSGLFKVAGNLSTPESGLSPLWQAIKKIDLNGVKCVVSRGGGFRMMEPMHCCRNHHAQERLYLPFHLDWFVTFINSFHTSTPPHLPSFHISKGLPSALEPTSTRGTPTVILPSS